MNVTNALKQPGLDKRGFFALIHDDTGRVYTSVTANIRLGIIETMDQLKAGKHPNSKLQRFYNSSPNFQVVTQVSSDGMRGAKKDERSFCSTISSYLTI